jgi:hypothetical protein
MGVFDPVMQIPSERTWYCLAVEKAWRGAQRKYIG